MSYETEDSVGILFFSRISGVRAAVGVTAVCIQRRRRTDSRSGLRSACRSDLVNGVDRTGRGQEAVVARPRTAGATRAQSSAPRPGIGTYVARVVVPRVFSTVVHDGSTLD